MPFAPVSTINLPSFNTHYLQVAAAASTELDAISSYYPLDSFKSAKDLENIAFGPSVSSPLIHRDSSETKIVQVGGGLSYKLTK